jgi:hypothetical protein
LSSRLAQICYCASRKILYRVFKTLYRASRKTPYRASCKILYLAFKILYCAFKTLYLALKILQSRDSMERSAAARTLLVCAPS